MPVIRKLMALLLLGLFANSAQAASCTFISPSAVMINFLTYVAGQASDLDGQSTLQVSCSKTALELPVSYAIYISTGGETDIGLRALRKPVSGSLLNYNLYTNSLRTIIWSESATTGTNRGYYQNTCTLLTCNDAITVYGRIPKQQSPAPGAYTDDVVVTLEY